MDSNSLTSEAIPQYWRVDDHSSTTCTCAVPIRHVKAARKGAAHTYCARCDLPIRLALESR